MSHELPRVIWYILNPEATPPTYAYEGDACFDLRSAVKEFLNPGDVKLVPLGFSVSMSLGWQLNIYARSGLAGRGISIPNSPGIVDCGYNKELQVLLENRGPDQFQILPGDRIAQGAFNPVYAPTSWGIYDSINIPSIKQVNPQSNTVRAGGWGSSGVK